jgi:Rieske Fe-S protein
MTNTDETTSTTSERVTDTALSRRVMLRSATLGGLSLPLLAACGGGDEATDTASDAASSAEASSPSEAASAPASGLEVPTSDVPVGGGAIFPDDKVVVTQPTKGDFKAFSATCTHKGCPVSEIAKEEIVCKCHGSRFSIKDGSVVNGPAEAPLAAKKVAVDGAKITVT